MNTPRTNVHQTAVLAVTSLIAAVSVGDFSTTGVRSFSTPDDWEDAILTLEAAEGQR